MMISFREFFTRFWEEEQEERALKLHVVGSLVGVEGEGGGDVGLQQGDLLDALQEGLVGGLLVLDPALLDSDGLFFGGGDGRGGG